MGRGRSPFRVGSGRAKLRAVHPAQDFTQDVASQIAWLLKHRDETWVARLRADLGDARALLSRFPEAGPLESAGDFRRLVLKRTPFVIWYVEAEVSVVMLRLFHVRQSAPVS